MPTFEQVFRNFSKDQRKDKTKKSASDSYNGDKEDTLKEEHINNNESKLEDEKFVSQDEIEASIFKMASEKRSDLIKQQKHLYEMFMSDYWKDYENYSSSFDLNGNFLNIKISRGNDSFEDNINIINLIRFGIKNGKTPEKKGNINLYVSLNGIPEDISNLRSAGSGFRGMPDMHSGMDPVNEYFHKLCYGFGQAPKGSEWVVEDDGAFDKTISSKAITLTEKRNTEDTSNQMNYTAQYCNFRHLGKQYIDLSKFSINDAIIPATDDEITFYFDSKIYHSIKFYAPAGLGSGFIRKIQEALSK